jgi:multidrug efflux pump subunit AcrA (membrane-fusion protein)
MRHRPALIVLSLLIASFCTLARAEAPLPPVDTEVVRVMPILKKLDLSGTVTSPQASQLSTAVAGPVTAVHFDTGASVKAGEVLLEIDAALEQATLKKADAQAAQAAAEVADAKRRLQIAERLAKRDYGPQNEVEARQAEVEIDIATHEAFKAERDRQAVILQRHKLRAPYARFPISAFGGELQHDPPRAPQQHGPLGREANTERHLAPAIQNGGAAWLGRQLWIMQPRTSLLRCAFASVVNPGAFWLRRAIRLD